MSTTFTMLIVLVEISDETRWPDMARLLRPSHFERFGRRFMTFSFAREP
jgi:hypothetical protein